MKRSAFTLIELLVVISILSVLGLAVSTFFFSSYNKQQQLESQAVVERDVSLAIDRFNRVIRSSTQLLEATPTTLKIHGYPKTSDTVPSEIYFFVNNGVLSYTVTPPSGSAPNYTYDPANATTFLLLPKVTNSTSNPLFYYYNDRNQLLSSPYSLADIKLVEVSISALDNENYLTIPFVISTKVQLRNFKTNL